MRHLAFIRIGIGIWFFVDILSMLVSGYVQEAYIDARVHFPFYGFEWIKPLPAEGMYILFVCLALVSIGIAAGKYTKFCAAIFLLGFGYVFMIDIVYTLNKFYLFLLLSFYLLFLPSDRDISIRKWQEPQLKLLNIPYWMVLIFQLQLAIIYIFSGISKLNPDWIFEAQPLTTFFTYKWPFRGMDGALIKDIAYLFSAGGILFDLSIVFLLINKRTRYFGQLWQTAFHSLNFVILHIGSLSIFMCLLTWLLFPTPYIIRKLKLENSVISWQITLSRRYKKAVVSFLLIFFLIHVSVPFRHLIHGNDVNWTEKGHRFSWRLMTRTKSGSYVSLKVVDPISQEEWKITPHDYLTGRQISKMSGETDLLISFAHYLEREWQMKGYKDVEVYAKTYTRINGHKKAPLVPETLDLTTVSRSFLLDEVSLPRPVQGISERSF